MGMRRDRLCRLSPFHPARAPDWTASQRTTNGGGGGEVADEMQCHGAVSLSTDHADNTQQTTGRVTHLAGGHMKGGGVLKGT